MAPINAELSVVEGIGALLSEGASVNDDRTFCAAYFPSELRPSFSRLVMYCRRSGSVTKGTKTILFYRKSEGKVSPARHV